MDKRRDGGTPQPRLCVFCKHFYNEPYYQYSEHTDGGGFHSCQKGHHEALINHSEDLAEFRAKIKFAAKCPDYDEAEDEKK